MGLNSFRSRPSRRGGGGPPAWLIVLIAGALVFGGFYLFQGFQTFIRTGGLGVVEATQRAVVVSSATAVRVPTRSDAVMTLRPTATPIPECMDFRVTAANAVVRQSPSFNGATVTGYPAGTIVCVLSHEGEWYAIDTDRQTRRPELAYMHESVIEPVNPTPTPPRTYTPLPTVTELPTLTPSPTSSPETPNEPSETAVDARSTLPPAGSG